MNVLFLFGSPKRNGYTAQLCGAFLKGLAKTDSVKIVRLFDLLPKPCNDCGYCKAADGCSKKDLDEFMADYLAADLIVVASPIYLLSLPAPMKALFDRFQRFFSARFRRNIAVPIEKPKRAVLLLTAGSDGKTGAEIIEKQVERAFSVMHTQVVGTVLAEHTDTQPIAEPIFQQAYALAKQL